LEWIESVKEDERWEMVWQVAERRLMRVRLVGFFLQVGADRLVSVVEAELVEQFESVLVSLRRFLFSGRRARPSELSSIFFFLSSWAESSIGFLMGFLGIHCGTERAALDSAAYKENISTDFGSPHQVTEDGQLYIHTK
jgi:hypothetical protein